MMTLKQTSGELNRGEQNKFCGIQNLSLHVYMICSLKPLRQLISQISTPLMNKSKYIGINQLPLIWKMII